MKATRAIAIAAIAASSVMGIAHAQSISSVQAPAEFPPSTYTGRQYVDSQGCVFVRAGIDGNVTWVPRVSRSRKVICGFQPSLASKPVAAQATAPAPVETVKVAPATVVAKPVAAPKPKVAKAKPASAAAPQAKPVMIVKSAPAPQPVYSVQPTTMAQTKTIKVARAQPVTTVRRVKTEPRQAICRGANVTPGQYVTTSSGVVVRCVSGESLANGVIRDGQPHTIVRKSPAPVTIVRRVTPSASYNQPAHLNRTGAYSVPALPAHTRVVKRSIYENQVVSSQGVYIPKGYKAVWEDDRLNPNRTHQTFEGMAHMELVWTTTVPRRLIDRRSGRDVSHLYPGLQYPYLSNEQQQAAISTRGSTTRQASKTTNSKHDAQRQGTRQKSAKATVSTRSGTLVPKTAAASHRYVQAGMFANQDQAKRAAQKLANSGLPAKLGKVKRNGKSYGVVVAGPFKSQAQLNSALQRVRSLGFGNAVLRK